MLTRCSWADERSDIYLAYHDQEWGVAKYDDKELFELLVLEMFQSGLSWLTILKKRPAFREAFDYFDVDKVANYSSDKVMQLLQNAAIIRNRAKIEAAIHNAKCFKQIQDAYGSFADYIWSFTSRKIQTLAGAVSSPLAEKITHDLKQHGMQRLGTTTVHSYLQAIGVINGHERGCFLRTAQ